MLSTLGKANWAVRPPGGAGAYRAVQRADGGVVGFSGSAAHGLGTALMLASKPHRFGQAKSEGFDFRFDAAERSERPDQFRVGIVGLAGTSKPFKCPKWMCTLQQAEL